MFARGRQRERAAEQVPSERVQAAKRLRVRTRRQVTDVFAGHYVSAFRGQGLEYAESRLYVPGDDVRAMDWNATARTGRPHVKEHRSERGRTLIAAIDLSSSMRFGTTGRSKAAAVAEAVALLATAALGVGDRFGLVLHSHGELSEIAPARGQGQLQRLLDALSLHVVGGEGISRATSKTSRGRPARRIPDPHALLAERQRRGAVLCEFTDARSWPALATRAVGVGLGVRGGGLDVAGRGSATIAVRPARGERVFVLCSDPTELQWPERASARIRPGDSGPALFFDGRDPAALRRFETAAAGRVARIAHSVRVRGDDFVHFRCERDPLALWLEFFRSRECSWTARG